ncbi:MAG: ester cyclase [Chitinophagaceae bacterium]|nr:ester cyclase [Chitinophagaceae bacterium]
MSTTMLEKTPSATTLKNMEAYFKTHDVQYIAEDAVFINLGTGERTQGRKAIGEMLYYIYHVAFDAKAEVTHSLITEEKAVLEGFFVGKHINEFAGIPATQKDVRVPLCVSYNLKESLITEARIYMLGDVMFKQLQ